MSLFAELKRRNVIRMAGLYLVGAWLLVQVAGTVLPWFGVSPSVLRGLVLVLVIGFVPALMFAWVFELTPDGIKRDEEVPLEKSIAPQTAQRMNRMIIAMLLLALGYFALTRTVTRTGSESLIGGPTGQPAKGVSPISDSDPVLAVPDAVSIAVLPFVNMSADPEQEYFSDGLSEELLNLLAQLPQLRVIARTSSFSFKGKEADVATIARQLNVEHVLEGSVRKSGKTLRITAQLIRASDSSHLWSQTYDRELTDIFKVQDEIANAVVDALKVKLLPNQALTNNVRSENIEAYNLLLLGDQYVNRQNPEDLKRAEDAYLKALALDPGYGMAHAKYALVRYFIADASSDPAVKRDALALADKAVAVAPNLADAYSARSVTRLSFSRDWSGAQSDLEQARKLNAGDSGTQIVYWRLLNALGQGAEAVAVARKATELDPVNTIAWASLGRSLNGIGDFAAARVALERALAISPNSSYGNYQLGCNYLYQGQSEQALEVFKNMGNVGYKFAGIAMAEHSLGHAAKSDEALAELIKNYPGGAYQTAQAYAWRGEKDKLFEWLDFALDRNDGGVTFVKSDPIMARYRDDPRFAAFLRKLGLPE